MEHLKILNSRQVKELVKKLESQFGFSEKLDYAFLKSNKGKIYAVSRDISKLELEELRIDSVGMYFACVEKDGSLRLSIEGSQIVGPKATEKVVVLSDDQFKEWFRGNDVEGIGGDGFHIVKHGNDFLGCGRVSNGILRNFVPKTRRLSNPL